MFNYLTDDELLGKWRDTVVDLPRYAEEYIKELVARLETSLGRLADLNQVLEAREDALLDVDIQASKVLEDLGGMDDETIRYHLEKIVEQATFSPFDGDT